MANVTNKTTVHIPTCKSSFGYLTASADVARYQHPQFRTLELLLPASLWSDSFVEARLRYTLAPPPEAEESQLSSTTSASQPAAIYGGNSNSTASPLWTEKGKDVASLRPSWSLMAIYRNYKRTREKQQKNREHGKYIKDRKHGSVLIENATVPTDFAVEDSKTDNDGYCSNVVIDKERQSSKVCCEKGNFDGLSTSSFCDNSKSRDINTLEQLAADLRTSASTSSVASHQSSSEHAHRSIGLTGKCITASATDPSPQYCPFLSAAHRDALALFERVLVRVAAAHAMCPLCSPTRPPRWGRCAQRAMTTKCLRDHRTAGDLRHSQKPAESTIVELVEENESGVEGDGDATLASRRELLRCRASQLLQRQEERLQHLCATKPVLLKEKAVSHPLAQACTQLGGMSLLRVLAATL